MNSVDHSVMTKMETTNACIQCYQEGLITESELASSLARLEDKKSAQYVSKWHSHIQECAGLNWQFDFESDESQEVHNHIDALKTLAVKASKNLK